jgi:hypothetical protein
MEKEIWKDVIGYEGLYQISNLGNIFSIKRNILLKQSIDSTGYYVVGLTNKKTTRFRVHKLMAINFLNHKPCGYKYVIDHVNNNKLDNRIINIQIIDFRKNTTKDRSSKTKLGVSFYNNKYYVRIYFKNRNHYLGRYNNENEAALKYQEALNQIKLNKFIIKEIKKTSKYIGVSWNKNHKKWIANYKGKHLGSFDLELDARNKYIEIKNKNNALQKL